MPKTVVRVPNHLGDCLMAQPAIRALAENFDRDGLFLLIPHWAEPIYRTFDGISIIRTDRLHGLKAVRRQIRLLRGYHFDDGVILTPSFSSALILWLAGVKNRHGYSGDARRLALNYPLDRKSALSEHRSQSYYRLMESYLRKKLAIYRPRMTLSDRDLDEARKILSSAGISDSDKYIVIAPQAVAESRRWGAANYRSLALQLTRDRNYKIILIGTMVEFSAGEIIAQRQDGIANLCGRTDIGSAAAILSQARLFIGNDSGLAHLAAAVDIPLVVLSGADNPAETSPLSDKKKLIIRGDLECISCAKNICPKKGKDFMRCMKEITVEEISSAARGLLELYS
jgi:heptosyltransferase-2